MRKVVVPFNGSFFPDGALNFALELNRVQPILLTGVFMPQAKYAYLWSDMSLSTVPSMPLLEEISDETAAEHVKRFKSFCESNGIGFSVHKDIRNFVLSGLTHETRFADLIIISNEKLFESASKEQVITHLKDTIHVAECPVIVLPEAFDFPQRNIILYDGSPSSVYAIKQFAYLLPELCNNQTLLFYSGAEEEDDLPEANHIEEFAGQHYKHLTILKSKADPRKHLTTWPDEEKNGIVISGAFGRSKLSQVFRGDFIADVIAAQKIPLFIAHR